MIKSRITPTTIGLSWLVLLTLAALQSRGWLQPDEHARVLEPAHFIAYGFASLPWEFEHSPPIVSWLLGYLLSPLFIVTKFFSATGTTQAFLARLTAGLIASTRLIALWFIFKELGLKRERRPLYLAICALALFGPMMFVRTSQENFALTALLWAFTLHFRVINDAPSFRRSVVFAFLLVFATTLRLQLGPSALCLGAYTLASAGARSLLPFMTGVLLGLLPMGIVDAVSVGTPFLPAWSYLQYALGGEEGGEIWGTSPWWFYFKEFFEAWYPPLSLFLIAPLILGVRRSTGLAVIVVPFTIIHIVLGHKETRYFSPMIPFFQLATFYGWERIEDAKPRLAAFAYKFKTVGKFFLGLFFSFGILSGFVELNTSPDMYVRLGYLLRTGIIDSYTYVGNTRTNPSTFFTKYTKQGALKGRIALDHVRENHLKAEGWLAFYSIDPTDYNAIKEQCRVVYVSIERWERDLLSLLPKGTPTRRRVNAIASCDKPITLPALTN